MNNAIVRTFSLNKIKDVDIIDHLNNLPNASKYIVSLIRADIQNGKDKENIEAKIKKLINEALSQRNLTTMKKGNEQKVIDAIKKLF